MTARYHQLIEYVTQYGAPHWSAVLGSYDRSDVEFEMEDLIDHGTARLNLKIITFPGCPIQRELEHRLKGVEKP
jgi:hypothetical protein